MEKVTITTREGNDFTMTLLPALREALTQITREGVSEWPKIVLTDTDTEQSAEFQYTDEGHCAHNMQSCDMRGVITCDNPFCGAEVDRIHPAWLAV